MAKKSRAARKAEAMKARQLAAESHQREAGAGMLRFARDPRIPSVAIAWSLGALAFGAAAVSSYIYRDRLLELYNDAMKAMDRELPVKKSLSQVHRAATGRKLKTDQKTNQKTNQKTSSNVSNRASQH